MELWKLGLLSVSILSVPWAVLQLVLWVCRKDEDAQDKKKNVEF